MSVKKIAVLITVFNRREKTLKCLKNLFVQVIPSDYLMDVYLTNDGCTDGTPESVRQKFPQVHVIDAAGDLYWNRGMWTAWETASKEYDYDYYLWLNDDTFLLDNATKTLLDEAIIHHNESVIVGPTTDSCFSGIITYGGKQKGKTIVPNGISEECDSFNGNIVLIPNYVYHMVGNLDYYYTHSKGDFDYGIRVKKAGLRIYQIGRFAGKCDRHEHIDKWCDPKVPLRDRIRLLNRPNGMPPNEIFHLEKQINYSMALLHYFTIYLRCFFPWIWTFFGKSKI